MLSLSQGVAGAAVAALIGVSAWTFLSEFPIPVLSKPSSKIDPLQVLEASVPTIGSFDEFNINDSNPFIPSNLRVVEQTTMRKPKDTLGRKPKPEPVIEVPPTPTIPRLPTPGQTTPVATGVIISQSTAQALITFPGDGHAQSMTIGENKNGWTLVAINDGNIVILEEEGTGHQLVLAIPLSENTISADEKADPNDKSGSKKPPAKETAGKDSSKGKTTAPTTGKTKPGQPTKADADKHKSTKKPAPMEAPPVEPPLEPEASMPHERPAPPPKPQGPEL